MTRVLLVEPDSVLSRTYAAALVDEGYEVVCAATAESAIVAADSQLPDLVVLELQIGSHNGIEFLHEFRSHEDWLAVPVIIHTLEPKAVLAKHASSWRSFGVSAVLSKTTTNLAGLKTVIRGVLS